MICPPALLMVTSTQAEDEPAKLSSKYSFAQMQFFFHLVCSNLPTATCTGLQLALTTHAAGLLILSRLCLNGSGRSHPDSLQQACCHTSSCCRHSPECPAVGLLSSHPSARTVEEGQWHHGCVRCTRPRDNPFSTHSPPTLCFQTFEPLPHPVRGFELHLTLSPHATQWSSWNRAAS